MKSSASTVIHVTEDDANSYHKEHVHGVFFDAGQSSVLDVYSDYCKAAYICM
jgi:hypothetical protein